MAEPLPSKNHFLPPRECGIITIKICGAWESRSIAGIGVHGLPAADAFQKGMVITMEASIKKRENGGWRDNYFLKAFFLGMGLSFLVFLPFLLVDGGRFLFYGDFNVQQVPFYRIAHDAIRSGNWGWSHLTDLGANFVGSYSFYLLGSPFFWLTIPFPSESLQYLMGPLFILKFASATLTGYVYLHRYTKSRNTALIGSVLYAFSGFSIYNIFFNHFHEAIIFFPLMLAALDEYMENRRRGLFALTVFACCFVNYYFFVGQVTFTLIYFFLRLLCRSWRISLRDFLLLALEAVLGVGMACVLLIPSVLTVTQNYRTSNYINGWNAVLYNKNQCYLHILECFFFPPDLPARPNFTPESESKWASLGAWLPLFGMTGVIGWLQLRRKHWLKKMLWVLFLMALVPFLNSSFQLMNSSYYARWYYMLTLMMALATVMALENERVNWKRSITWTLTITAAIAAVIGFMPTLTKEDGKLTDVTFGLEKYPTRFWTYVAVSMICIGAVAYLFCFCKDSRRHFQRATLVCLSLVSVFYSIFFIAIGKTQSEYTYDHIIPYALNGGKNIDLPDLQSCRSDFYESLDNSAMFWEIPSIQAFHSIVPGSVMEFYDSIGVPRDVASRPKAAHYALRALTSVHWLFDDDHDDDYFAGESLDDPAMPGWAYYGNANGFDIWENKNYIPMGFTYDYYLSRSDFNALSEGDENSMGSREPAMLRAVVLEDDTIRRLSGLLQELPEDRRNFTEESFEQDCADRRLNACTSFAYTNTGFTAEINTDRERLVFFSVPYEAGWSARVNGEPVDIERVNVGFMAVVAPRGEKVQIEFTYRTPGLIPGLAVTVFSVLLLAAYLAFARRRLPPDPAPANPGLLRRGSFSDYAKARRAAFLRPGAMIPREFLPRTLEEEPESGAQEPPEAPGLPEQPGNGPDEK